MGAANQGGLRYVPSNIRLAHVTVNGTLGYGLFIFDLCGAKNGVCVPGATLKDVHDIVTYTFDDDHKITGYYDWWEPGTMAKVDSLVQQVSLSSKKVTASSLEVPFLPTTFAMSAVITS